MKNILARGLEQVKLPSAEEPEGALVLFHEHLRGADYYREEVI